ncbi:MAG TPA: DUF971 domain-containing protein [Thermoanaerobaculia bacterium]|jgi:DUF971 family protein|nr:DUF971 domain-containing protein [Thermoanaerobaculia bacterium]
MAIEVPRSIQQIGRELVVVWEDGREDYFSLERLRRECPCAMCRGESDLMGNVYRAPKRPYGLGAFLMHGWKKVGGYAIQIYWQDGHNDGIYTYELLRKLGEATETG